jgi:Phage integrase, N-terminal SAM-like domain
MSRSHTESLLSSTQSFFQNYLRQTRGASAHTVRAYRDALKLFFLFLAEYERKPVAGLTLDDVRANTVLAFLEHIETRRGNSAITRNCRLAAVRSFVQYLLRHDVTRAGQYGAVLAIRTKRATRRAVTYLEPEEARVDRRHRRALTAWRTRSCAAVVSVQHGSPCSRSSVAPSIGSPAGPAQTSAPSWQREQRADLPVVAGNRNRPASDHPRRQRRRSSIQERDERAIVARWRGVSDPEACKDCGRAMSGFTETPHHASCATPQLRVRAPAGGSRHHGDS